METLMNTNLVIKKEPIEKLSTYSEISIAFEVKSIFNITGDDPATAEFKETSVEFPWIKNYDGIKDEGPTRWGKCWDISNWGLLVAYDGDTKIGGCVLTFKTDGVNKLEGRDDLTVMWDIRVAENYRGKGIGRALFQAAIKWAKQRNCTEIKIETQNINVSACKFYEKQGCKLYSIKRGIYKNLPDEIELMWSYKL